MSAKVIPFKTKEMREFDKHINEQWEELLRRARDWDLGDIEIELDELTEDE